MNHPLNPYAGNILIEKLPPILSFDERLKFLTSNPEVPDNLNKYPYEIRLHYLLELTEHFYLPSMESCQLLESIDLMIRNNYRNTNPNQANTWKLIYSNNPTISTLSSITVSGHSGVGKTTAIKKSLNYFPQIVTHSSFPNIHGEHYQMVWQSIEVPGSGRLIDFMADLMNLWDSTLERNSLSPRFSNISTPKSSGNLILSEWLQVAKSHFLGILHIDEVQNFFHLPSLKDRQITKNQGPFELKLVDDRLIKTLLNLCNSGLPIIFSGTPDGVRALANRFSTAQRSANFGYCELTRFESVDNPEFKIFIHELMKLQLVNIPITAEEEVGKLIIELTAGIKRLILTLWNQAHRESYLRNKDELSLNDFKKAAIKNFKYIKPAIDALNTRDPDQLRRYADLLCKI